MGCDIHFHVERRSEGVDNWEYMGEFSISRNYELFGHLAGVRAHEVETIHPPRGLPMDTSPQLNEEFEYCRLDAHSGSWCLLGEAHSFFLCHEQYEYIDHEFHAFLKFMNQAFGAGEIRFVYWFDN